MDWKEGSPALLPLVFWRSLLCSAETLPTIFKLLELKLCKLTRCPESRVHRQGSWNDWLEVRFGIPSGLQILFYFMMHSTFQGKKTRSGKDMSAVSSLMQLGMQGWGGLWSNPPPKGGCKFSEPCLPMQQGGGRGLSSINTYVMTSVSLP